MEFDETILLVCAAMIAFSCGVSVGLKINEHKIRDAIAYSRGKVDGIEHAGLSAALHQGGAEQEGESRG